MTVALETRALCKSFGALTVADRVDLRLEAGVRHALIGPNGAGKTTLVNMITGRLAPSAGQIFLAGEDVTRLSQAARVRRGLGRTFQINALFRDMSVLDNVALGIAERDGVGGRLWRPASAHVRVCAEALELLAMFGLTDDADRRVLDLPYGKQRLVEIAIALGLRPTVLLLDEPAAGVPREESKELFSAIAGLSRDIAVLFIEHDMELVFRFATRVIVMVAGSILVEGTPAEIASDLQVRAVYLGKKQREYHRG